MKYIKLIKEMEDRYGILSFPKKVYRGGNEESSDLFNKCTFFTDSEIIAKEYADFLHYNDEVYTKIIDFKNPLVLVQSLVNQNDFIKLLSEILGENVTENFYHTFPFNMNPVFANKIINYAIKNGYDGVVMDDTDITHKNIIKTYITLK